VDEGGDPQKLNIEPPGLDIGGGWKKCYEESGGDLYDAINSVSEWVDHTELTNEWGRCVSVFSTTSPFQPLFHLVPVPQTPSKSILTYKKR
jgi:hypothetical protein